MRISVIGPQTSPCQSWSAGSVAVTPRHGDASRPPFRAASFDVVLARHVLWAMPDPAGALARWVVLLRPQRRLALDCPQPTAPPWCGSAAKR
ncbi:methyltransferase domain-containing protein [Actinoplanes sp. NEAU-H7]|uniref:Methyltransferase domain-containing protein n=1 Tax=Actinoplanes flavus TaxID=2820290 RepID=A0ABS3UZK4_9ACTN|nr:methyltransferase domain-containing protein [Actinoplanes flavus]